MSGSRAHKRRLAVAGFACLAGVASAPLAVMSFVGGSDLALPGVQTAERLMAMLDARSPGERAEGALTQTKLRLATAPRKSTLVKPKPPTPPLEELAKVIVPAPPAPPVAALPPIVPPPAAADIIAPTTLTASAPVGFGSEIISGGFISGPPGGSTPPGSSAPPTSEVPPPPVTSAVPEPGTWAMMLLGFAMIGSAMPRRRHVRLTAEA